MKKLQLLLTLFLVMGIGSCSSDDEGNTEVAEQDTRILGKWGIQSLTVDGEEVEFTECEAQSTVEFLANGDAITTDFFEDFDTGECISEVYTEKWTYIGNNVYRFTDEGISYEVTIIFSNNNNVFTITTEEEDGTYVIKYAKI